MSFSDSLETFGFMIVASLFAGAYWLGIKALFPRFTDRTSQNWRRPFLCLLFGLVVSLPLVWISQLEALQQNEIERWITHILMLTVVLGGMSGLTGLVVRIGNGLRNAGENPNSWQPIARAAVVLTLVATFPLGERYLILMFLIATGLGAFLMAGSGTKKTRQNRTREAARGGQRTAPEGERENRGNKNRNPRRNRNPRNREDRERKGDGERTE